MAKSGVLTYHRQRAMKIHKVLTTFSLLFLLLSLSACGPIYNTNYAFEQPKSANGKQCTNTCLQNRSTCNMQCNAQNEQCRMNARKVALPAYVRYLVNQRKEEQAGRHDRDRTIDDFANYSNCSSNCDCESTYRQCFAGCGGIVIENRQCVVFCNKIPPNQLVQSQKIYQ